MTTQILGADGLQKAASILCQGGVVAMPTETVYGLAADALQPSAVDKIFAAKGRPNDNPLIVHISDMDMIFQVVMDFPDLAKQCAAVFWPGPLTLICPKHPHVPQNVTAGLATVAVRMPAHPLAQALIALTGPLAAPSANVSGKPSPVTAQDVMADMQGKIPLILDGGPCQIGLESTVLDMTCNPPRILRPGAVTAEMLQDVIGDVVVDDTVLSPLLPGHRVTSPGTKYLHYAPNAKLTLLEGPLCHEGAIARYDADMQKGLKSGILATHEDAPRYGDRLLLLLGDAAYSGLFSALRRSDDLHLDTLYAVVPKAQGIGLAARNRLLRAAAFDCIWEGNV